MFERQANRGRCSPYCYVADDREEPRVFRTVFQRRSPEEVALRRATVAELVRQANNEPREDQQQQGRWRLTDNGGGWGSPFGQGVSSLGANLRRPPSAHPTPVDGPLQFSSAFECGNLSCAKLACPPGKGDGASSSTAAPATAEAPPLTEVEYELHLEGDTQSPVGHTQWFYFCVRSREFQGLAHFRIVNLRKKRSLYQHGRQPYVYSVKRNRGWEPFSCEDVSYTANCNAPRRGGSDGLRQELSTLAWTYRIDQPDDEIYFASYPPYTYSMLSGFLARLERHPPARAHLCRSEMCRSIGQLPVPILVISQDAGSGRGEGSPMKEKMRPSIAIIARQHPGEVVGSWVVQGLIKFLLGPTPAARKLREAYVFHIVPMVNVDGVVHGNSRCTLAGVDPNRIWNNPNPILHPVIHTLKNHLRALAHGVVVGVGYVCKGLELFLDLHGHASKFGCFFYGANQAAPISCALFPKLCAITSQDISFEQCHWRCTRSHRKTARYVVYKQLHVAHSYTLECSLFAPVSSGIVHSDSSRTLDGGAGGKRFVGMCFTPGRVEWIGCAIGRAAASFLNVDGDCCGRDCSGNSVPPTPPTPTSTAGGGADEAGAEGEDSSQDAPAPNYTCACSDMDFLPNLSCPKVLACRQWLTIWLLESTSPAKVLEELTTVHGDYVTDLGGKPSRGDGSDDGGDSDGDDAPDAELEADAGGNSRCPSAKPAASPAVAQNIVPTPPVRPPRRPPPQRENSDKVQQSQGQRRVVAGRLFTIGGDGGPILADSAVAPQEKDVECGRRARSTTAAVGNRARSVEKSKAMADAILMVPMSTRHGNMWLDGSSKVDSKLAIAPAGSDRQKNGTSAPSLLSTVVFDGQAFSSDVGGAAFSVIGPPSNPARQVANSAAPGGAGRPKPRRASSVEGGGETICGGRSAAVPGQNTSARLRWNQPEGKATRTAMPLHLSVNVPAVAPAAPLGTAFSLEPRPRSAIETDTRSPRHRRPRSCVTTTGLNVASTAADAAVDLGCFSDPESPSAAGTGNFCTGAGRSNLRPPDRSAGPSPLSPPVHEGGVENGLGDGEECSPRRQWHFHRQRRYVS